MRSWPIARLLAIVIVAATLLACGKKGPPLAPLVRVPARPDDLVAERRGDTVHLQFTVPSTNTDGSRPGNVDRVDVYGFTGPARVTDEELLRLGRRIATVEVNAPPDPDQTATDSPPPEIARSGVDQGAVVRVTEPLTSDALTPVELPPSKPSPLAPRAGAVPAVPAVPALPASAGPTRFYAAVAVGGRRTGPASRRAAVPLVAAPGPPASPAIAYDEDALTVSWAPAEGVEPVAYHVYDVQVPAQGGPAVEVRLTKTPVPDLHFEDRRIEWGATRCYTVRAAVSAAGLWVESDAPSETCVTLTDTFAPASPSGLTTVASVGAISLIWDASSATDLAGYVVFKGPAGGPLVPATPTPVQETTFRDVVPPGTRVAYAVQAVDKVGNISARSAVVEETAR